MTPLLWCECLLILHYFSTLIHVFYTMTPPEFDILSNISVILSGALLTAALIMVLRHLAVKVSLLDIPGHRKFHHGPVPLIGGLSIQVAAVAILIWFDLLAEIPTGFLISTFFVLILGVFDDYCDVPASSRLVLLGVFSAPVIFVDNIYLSSLGSMFGFFENVELGFLAVPFTLIAVIGLSNAFNMIDGVDGLSGGLALLAIVGVYFFGGFTESSGFQIFLCSLLVPLITFLIFNCFLPLRFKVFLGCGSLLLGYVISWALIFFAERVQGFNPSAVLWCVAVPLFDLVATVCVRLKIGLSVFEGDMNHVHHALSSLGIPKHLLTLTILFFGVALIFVGIVVETYSPAFSVPVFLVIFLGYLKLRLDLSQGKFL